MAAHRLVSVLKAVLPIVVVALIALPAWNYWARRGRIPSPADSAQALPKGVAVLTEDVTFSQKDGDRTLFTVSAKVTLGLKDSKQMLRDVEVVVFPEKAGDPERRVQSEACSYDEQSGDIQFTGNVRVQLDETTRALTEELIYRNAERLISSSVRTVIEQPNAMIGEADQVEYFIDSGLLRLAGNVDINLADGGALRGGAAVFQKQEHWATISDGVHMESMNGWLRGDNGRAELDPGSLRPKRIFVDGHVTGESRTAKADEVWRLASDALQGTMSPGGGVEHVYMHGDVRVERTSGNQVQVLTGGELDGRFDPEGRITGLDTRQNAVFRGDGTLLRAPRIWMNADGGVATADESVLEVRDAVIEGRAFTIQQGDVVTFSTTSRAIVRSGERRMSGDRTEARFDSATNELIELTQDGHFEFTEGARSGRSGRAVVRDRGDSILLEGMAMVSEPSMKLEAGQIRLNKSGAFEASGAVRTTSLGDADPVLVRAAEAAGNSDNVTYTGAVQLWRGSDAYIEAEVVEASTRNKSFRAEQNVRSQLDVLRISSNTLDYNESRQTAHYMGNVLARKRDKQGDLVLETEDMTIVIANGEVLEAAAKGGVVMTQGGRRGVGDTALYDAEADQLTLMGSNAEITDPERGLIQGTRLDVKSGGEIVTVQANPDGRVTSKHKVTK